MERQTVSSKSCPTTSIPHVLKQQTESELDRLEQQEIIRKVEQSN